MAKLRITSRYQAVEELRLSTHRDGLWIGRKQTPRPNIDQRVTNVVVLTPEKARALAKWILTHVE